MHRSFAASFAPIAACLQLRHVILQHRTGALLNPAMSLFFFDLIEEAILWSEQLEELFQYVGVIVHSARGAARRALLFEEVIDSSAQRDAVGIAASDSLGHREAFALRIEGSGARLRFSFGLFEGRGVQGLPRLPADATDVEGGTDIKWGS